jgi:hypothetical protein
MRVRPFEEIFEAYGPVETVGSGLDSKCKDDRDGCGEGFELHFMLPGITERYLREARTRSAKGICNECEEEMTLFPSRAMKRSLY